MYFTWYELTESIKYAAMKLSGQTSQYWTNLENRRATRGRSPTDTWDKMKEELETKYVPPLFSACLIDNWHQHTQGNKSAKEYVEKFSEFLTDVVPSIGKVKPKFFLDSEPVLEITYELIC